METNRRELLKLAGMAGVAGAIGFPTPLRAASGRVVVVGGGFGGATVAKYLRMDDPGIEVTLVERDAEFYTCPFSNLVLGGLRDMASIRQDWKALAGHGIKVVQDEAVAVDPAGRTVTLRSGATLAYDRLVLSPGVDLNYAGIEGYSEAAADRMPHAWKAGTQTVLLRRQLEAMPDGGTVIMVAPDNPYRCPPGPYERAAMIGNYLKANKPKSKILIFDPKTRFSKQGLFLEAYANVYPGMIQWIGGDQGGKVKRVDPAKMTVESDFGEERGDVVNVIPPQRAGRIAELAGCADAKGWCAVDPASFESRQQRNIHVVGDSAIAGAMPKSATAANAQAKVCAAAIVALLNGKEPGAPSLSNTCYSMISRDYAISITGVYEAGKEGIKEAAGGVSPLNAPADFRQQEAQYTLGWYDGITADTFS